MPVQFPGHIGNMDDGTTAGDGVSGCDCVRGTYPPHQGGINRWEPALWRGPKGLGDQSDLRAAPFEKTAIESSRAEPSLCAWERGCAVVAGLGASPKKP